MTKEQKAIQYLIKKYAVLSKNISYLPFTECCKRFIPSNIKKGSNWVKQSVHIIYTNGSVQSNACCPAFNELEEGCCLEKGTGRSIGDIISSKPDADKVVLVIQDGIDKCREMIVYQLPH